MKDTRPDIKGVMESSLLIFLENQERTLEVVALVAESIKHLYIYTHTHTMKWFHPSFLLNNDN